MKKIKLALLLTLILALVLLVVQNTGPVQAHFLGMTAEIPVIVLLFFTTAGGIISGLFVALLLKSSA
ncbi:MAG: LapA family protein [Leptolyngbyaceae cyanobacterium MO_188.B28]|nr:LapA family protein [Leptolyngbyaceae cyanobacterium MO_188.B28]